MSRKEFLVRSVILSALQALRNRTPFDAFEYATCCRYNYFMSVIHNSVSPHRREGLERAVLCALCQQFNDQPFRARTIDVLTHFRFTLADHQCIFDALSQIPASDSRTLRQHLMNRLSNMGFPDLDIAFLFEGPSCSPDWALQKLRDLLALTEKAP